MTYSPSFVQNFDYTAKQGFFGGQRLTQDTFDADSKDFTGVTVLPYGVFVVESGGLVALPTADTQVIAGLNHTTFVNDLYKYTVPTLGAELSGVPAQQPATIATRGTFAVYTADTIVAGDTLYVSTVDGASVGKGYVTTTSVGNIALGANVKIVFPTADAGAGLVGLRINLP